MRLVEYHSLDEFRAAGPAWDDLWLRGDVALPTARAELVAGWTEQFAAGGRLLALAVEQDGRLVAGLALTGSRLKRFLPAGSLTQNAWARCGDLLLDPAVDGPAACRLLAAGLRGAPWPLVRMAEVPLQAPRWRQLCAAFDAARMACLARVDYQVGQVEIPAAWEDLGNRWPRNHRRKLRRIAQKLEERGQADLERCVHPDPADVPRLFRQAFEIEDRGWKGQQGTSVMAAPGMFDYYCRVGRQLAEWGALELAFLRVDGRPIAFHCGSRAKRTTFSSKVGYDEQFAEFSPGNALLHRLLRALHEEHGAWTHDLAGPLSEWTARFATSSYPVGSLLLAPGGAVGRWLLKAYGRWGNNGSAAVPPNRAEPVEFEDGTTRSLATR